MPDYVSVREHRLYATDGALPDHLESGDFPASLGESPETVSLDSVNHLFWTIVFDNAEPGASFHFSVWGGLVCFDWYGNEQVYFEYDVLTVSESTHAITYDYSNDLDQYNPGF